LICARAISADRPADLDLAFARLHLPQPLRESALERLPYLQILLTELGGADRQFLAQLDPDSHGAAEVSVVWGDDPGAALLGGRREELQELAASAKATAPELAGALEGLLRGIAMSPVLRVGSKTLVFGARTHLMGVINVTPDSFSDGGQFLDPERAVAHGLKLVAAGADFLDVGGESTRPGAVEVDPSEELRRIAPVLRGLRAKTEVPISVDTRKAAVAEAAIELGADLINDVSGFQFDPALPQVVGRSSAACCVMHAQGPPQTMQNHPRYRDVIAEILAFLGSALDRAIAAGIAKERILVDPGIGFGKTAGQNLLILRRLSDFRALGRPILVGTSRKSFLQALTRDKLPSERLIGTLGSLAAIAASGSADLLRVHDVREAKEAVAVADAIRQAKQAGELFESGQNG
jgi:dihydropteroate synthase